MCSKSHASICVLQLHDILISTGQCSPKPCAAVLQVLEVMAANRLAAAFSEYLQLCQRRCPRIWHWGMFYSEDNNSSHNTTTVPQFKGVTVARTMLASTVTLQNHLRPNKHYWRRLSNNHIAVYIVITNRLLVSRYTANFTCRFTERSKYSIFGLQIKEMCVKKKSCFLIPMHFKIMHFWAVIPLNRHHFV